MWWGGFAIGPRYFLPAVPFLALAMGFAVRQWAAQGWFKIAAGVALLWSLVINVGLTIAGQAFPPDTLFNPVIEYAWPNWASGNIARNIGTVLGLKGIFSLVPLLLFLVVMAAVWAWYYRRPAGRSNNATFEAAHE